MTLKEQIIWTILGIDNKDILKKILEVAEQFSHQKDDILSSKQDPTSFLPLFSNIKTITVEEALSPHYEYPIFPKESIVGQWPGDDEPG